MKECDDLLLQADIETMFYQDTVKLHLPHDTLSYGDM
jgi:hypothetical protein